MTQPLRASATVGIHLKIGSALCMTLMMACVKGLDGAVPPGQIAFYRSAVTLLPVLDDETPLSRTAQLGVAAGLGAALFGALSIIQIRHLAATEKPGAIVFYYTLMTGVLGSFSLMFGWVMPDLRQLLLLLSAGLFGGVANLLIAQSLRHAHASVTAPFEYTTLVWSALISYSVFGQAPGVTVMAGGALVAASGLFTVWQESRVRGETRAAG